MFPYNFFFSILLLWDWLVSARFFVDDAIFKRNFLSFGWLSLENKSFIFMLPRRKKVTKKCGSIFLFLFWGTRVSRGGVIVTPWSEAPTLIAILSLVTQSPGYPWPPRFLEQTAPSPTWPHRLTHSCLLQSFLDLSIKRAWRLRPASRLIIDLEVIVLDFFINENILFNFFLIFKWTTFCIRFSSRKKWKLITHAYWLLTSAHTHPCFEQ